MAMNSPGQQFVKSPKSPRQLPQLPIKKGSSSIGGFKSPGTPRVFEFPPECNAETPNTNFDFEDFVRAAEAKSPTVPKSPMYLEISKSPKSPSQQNSLPSPSQDNRGSSPTIFKFCSPRRTFSKTLSCPPKSPMSPSVPSRSSSSMSFGPKSPNKPYRRNSCFSFGPKSPMSPTIVTRRSPSPNCTEMEQLNGIQRSNDFFGNNSSKQGSSVDLWLENNSESNGRKSRAAARIGNNLNKSSSCLSETEKSKTENKGIARRSTSDLTEIGDTETEVTVLSSPRRRGSMKGGLGKDLFGSLIFLLNY